MHYDNTPSALADLPLSSLLMVSGIISLEINMSEEYNEHYHIYPSLMTLK